MTDTNQTQHQGESQDQQQDKTANDALLVQLQAEVERLRKHCETLLAEKKAETKKRRAEQAEKDKQAQEIARKKAILKR